MDVLIMTSVDAEKVAVLQGLKGFNKIKVQTCGVGIASAATKTALALASYNYDVVINMGIAGGFAGKCEIGTLAVAKKIIAADLGAETEDGFIRLDELGFGSAEISVDQNLAERVVKEYTSAHLPVTTGSILTVSTVTGSARTAKNLTKQVPEAVAEAMEGYGVAFAADDQGIPVLEIRAISNIVGPRNREAWRIKEALHMLADASAILAEVLT